MTFNPITRRRFLVIAGAAGGTGLCSSRALEVPEIAPQPYFANVSRALDALARLGAPVTLADQQQIVALRNQNDNDAVTESERILERYTLARVHVESNGYAYATVGGAQRTLVEQGWRLFLVRIFNPESSTNKLNLVLGGVWAGQLPPTLSPSASRESVPYTLNVAPDIEKAWVVAQLDDTTSMQGALSGFAIEYRVIQLYSRTRGHNRQEFYFLTATDRLANLAAKWRYRRGVALDFDCLPSRDVTLRIRDADGPACMASLVIRDQFNRVYPPQVMRLAPDMRFQRHIYRGDGETVRLPDGEYTVESTRGPEYLRHIQKVVVGETGRLFGIRLKRWIDPARWGWYSGDTHIHAAGCSHYAQQQEGVAPATVIRHVRGEGLSIAEVLTWGPGWYYQKQFFTGRAESPPAALEHPELQLANHTNLQPHALPRDAETLLRYDVEVSGFPSSHCGHLALLRLKEQDYPATRTIQDWPSFNLPILSWAKAQGAVVGYAHCGQGMSVNADDALPNYGIPRFDGPGAHEAIVDVTHGCVDFLAGCNGNPVAELNVWYHMLNCGFRLAMLGETDYPCIDDERPGVGRTYVQLDRRPVDNSGYESWILGLQKGRLYCGDGRSHFLEFTVHGDSSNGNVLLRAPGRLLVRALVAARLEPEPLRDRLDLSQRLNGWHIENARIGETREVPVELIVNGLPLDRVTLVADGTPQAIEFSVHLARSSWIALRILPSAHTHPIFAEVGGRPIRASKRSARWCRACVDKLWEVNSSFIRESEQAAATGAFDHARQAYDGILRECEVE